jgi:16S rRNA (guanine527-N7)-methyltransferase
MSIESQVEHGARELGVALPAEAASRMAQHVALIEKWNRVHNLTAVREPEQMAVLHVLDSLSLVPHVGAARTVLDVGAGAGFPGVPLALARQDLQVTLLDSSHKKATFLEQAKAELRLANVGVACERVETWNAEAGFDCIVSRAFAELADFVKLAAHLLAPGGRILAMKGVYPYEEIARIPPTHRVAEVLELKVPTLDAKRHLVRIEAA